MSGRGRTRSVAVSRFAVLGLCLLLPTLMGGCPEFRNAAVSAIDNATKSVLISDVESQVAGETATDNILSAALTLFFDQFRTDEVGQ